MDDEAEIIEEQDEPYDAEADDTEADDTEADEPPYRAEVEEPEAVEPFDAEETGDGASVETSGEPDVLLDVPTLHVDEIDLEVEDLRARVSLQAEVLDLLKINVGADVALGRVELDIKGVDVQALLKVRLENVLAVVERLLLSVDRNPQILEQLTGAVGSAVRDLGSGGREAVGELGRGVADLGEEVGQGAGKAVGEVGEEVGQGVGAAAGELGSGAGKAVGEVGEEAGELVDDLGETASETVEGAGGAVEGTAKSAHRATGAVGAGGPRKKKAAKRPSREKAPGRGADGPRRRPTRRRETEEEEPERPRRRR